MMTAWMTLGRTTLALALLAASSWSAAQDAPPPQAGRSELAVEADRLVDEIEQHREVGRQLEAELEQAEGEQALVLEKRLTRSRLELLEKLFALVDNVQRQEERGLDAASYRDRVTDYLLLVSDYIRTHVEPMEQARIARDAERESLAPEDLLALERELADETAWIDTVLQALVDATEAMERFGLDTSQEREFLRNELPDRAATIAGHLRLSKDQYDALTEQLKGDPANAELQARVRAAEAKLEGYRGSLTSLVGMLRSLDLETAEYQKVLIETTGEITTDLLDTDVALTLFRQWTADAYAWIAESGPALLFKLLLFVLIVLAFKFLASFVRRMTARALDASKLKTSTLARDMIVTMIARAVIVVGVLVALSQLGLSLGPLLAGVGIVGFIVGFALQDSLSNFAAGMMILIYRPYDVGDMVEAAGVYGKVEAMSLVSTTILTIDNQTLVVPNAKIWGDVIRNVTAQTIRRVDLTFGIGYSDDVEHAERVLMSILKDHDKVLDEPEPIVKLHELGDSSVNFTVRPWVNTDDYWDVYWDVTREVKLRFDREGISIPFPQRDVHLHRASGEASEA